MVSPGGLLSHIYGIVPSTWIHPYVVCLVYIDLSIMITWQYCRQNIGDECGVVSCRL